VSTLRWWIGATALGLGVGAPVGVANALFLWAQNEVIRWHWTHPISLWGLPFFGVSVAWAYARWGRGADEGTSAIVGAVRGGTQEVTWRMAPLVFLGTLLAHAGGGSVGREGTAVQIGGGIASGLARWRDLDHAWRRLALSAGMAAGFGAIFGTPWAGAIFAREVVGWRAGRWREWWVLGLASWVGCVCCSACGIARTAFPTVAEPEVRSIGWVAVIGLAMASAAWGYTWVKAGTVRALRRCPTWGRPVLGATVIIGLTYALGTRDFLGLGLQTPPGGDASILAALTGGTIGPTDWLWKLVFTALMIGSGFKGGEVTPLFFVGATLAYTIASPLGVATAPMAVIGMVAIFAAIARCPWSYAVMGGELFGLGWLPWCLGASLIATAAAPQRGLYEPRPMP
jgi:H+/Cl- antiporter ClcA